MRAECDVELYLDDVATTKLCDAGGFDATSYYNEHGIRTLYNASGEKVRQLLPWETVEQKYTIGIGRREKVYVCDGIGTSGKMWKGLFKTPCIWDGIDVSKFPLEPTGIAPCPSTQLGGKFRNFFYLYTVDGGLNNAGYEGVNSTLFRDGRSYPRTHYDVHQVINMQRARANNSDPLLPYPFAEGGFHALNAFICSQEAYYDTNYIHSPDRFDNGISSTYSCTDEISYDRYGGCRVRKIGDTDWIYDK